MVAAAICLELKKHLDNAQKFLGVFFFFWGGGKERSCMEPGVELDDPCGSLRTQDIL